MRKDSRSRMIIQSLISSIAFASLFTISFTGCERHSGASAGAKLASDAAEKVYVPPGKYDEFYAFMSGGYSGQVSVYGLPSGRLLKIIPVFSEFPENGYGYSEETKAMLQTDHGSVAWDDAHHPELSMTDGAPDGKWLYINANNTPRIARIDLSTFTTAEILQIPNSAGNHGSPFSTMNGEYLVASTRFSLPIPQRDVPISTYKQNFKGTISFVKVDKETGHMNLAFQILVPGIDYDLARCGRGKSQDWCFFTSYNSEEAHTLLEVNASQRDKDLMAAINWKKAAECVAEGKAKTTPASYVHNVWDDATMMASSEKLSSVRMLKPQDCPGMMYYIPVAKSPHGVNVDPSGEYIVTGGKLAAQVTAFSFSKMEKAIADNKVTEKFDGIPVLDYPSVLAGEIQNLCLGPLHDEFDGKGYGYTSCFISSEIVKWKIGTWKVVDRIPTYYSPGHLMIPGGDSAKPWGKYLVSLNKITKDRYLPTGPELDQSAQLIDISGDKMQLLLDFPTIGEPHYAQAIPASLVVPRQKKIYEIQNNRNLYVTRSEADTKVVRKGNRVDVYMTTIRSHLAPDNIEGVKVGDTVYFHLTNLEQDWDIPHGFAVFGNTGAELIIMPGETETLKFEPKAPGIYPYYCTDFCSALHQEMQGYLRVSAAGSNIPIEFGTGK